MMHEKKLKFFSRENCFGCVEKPPDQEKKGGYSQDNPLDRTLNLNSSPLHVDTLLGQLSVGTSQVADLPGESRGHREML